MKTFTLRNGIKGILDDSGDAARCYLEIDGKKIPTAPTWDKNLKEWGFIISEYDTKKAAELGVLWNDTFYIVVDHLARKIMEIQTDATEKRLGDLVDLSGERRMLKNK